MLTVVRLGGRLGESLTERTSCERVRFLGVLPGVLDAMAATVFWGCVRRGREGAFGEKSAGWRGYKPKSRCASYPDKIRDKIILSYLSLLTPPWLPPPDGMALEPALEWAAAVAKVMTLDGCRCTAGIVALAAAFFAAIATRCAL